MELIGILLEMAPVTKSIHEQRAVSANRTRFSTHIVPLVCSFILQHCNMDSAITNLHVWSQTIRTQGPKKSQETVCLCSQADGTPPRGELDGNGRSGESWPGRRFFGCQGNFLHLHPYEISFNMLQLCHIEELSFTKMIFLNLQKHSQSNIKVNADVCAPGTLVRETWHQTAGTADIHSAPRHQSLISNGRRNKSIQQY